MNKEYQRGIAMVPITVGVLAVILILGTGYYFLNNEQQSPDKMDSDEKMTEAEMIKRDDTLMEKDEKEMMKKDEEKMMIDEDKATNGNSASTYQGEVLAGTTSPLLSFQQADYDKALAENKTIVLYFYASWCPTCRAEFPLMEKAFDQLDNDQVVGFRVNFNDNDTDKDEKELAREHGVPYQHTKVFVKNGEQVLKSPEQWTTARYLSEINEAL